MAFFDKQAQQNFPDFRSILELPSGFGEPAGPTANERFTGQIIVDGKAIPVEAGEALFKGQIYKVGQANDKGQRSVFDGKGKVVGTAGLEGEDVVFRAPTISSENDRIFGGDPRLNPTFQKQVAARTNPNFHQRRGERSSTPQLDNITKLLQGEEFDAAALIGGGRKKVRDELKAATIRKILGFFSGGA